MSEASLIQPFRAFRPIPEIARQASAPPYDVLDSQEARAMAEGNPLSFLRVSKAEITLPPGTPVHDPLVYQTASANLQSLIDNHWFMQDATPCYYLYRLTMAGREQTGVVAAASVDGYLANRIKKHELTRPDKENDRTDFARATSSHSGPVFLVFRHNLEILNTMAEAINQLPAYDFTSDDGVRHTLWVVADAGLMQRFTVAFDKLPAVYVADGHHRSAAAARICQEKRRAQADYTGEEAFNRFPGVFFPDNQVQIMDYNRVVRDLNGRSDGEFLQALAGDFQITASPEPVRPGQKGDFGLFLKEGWFHLRLKVGADTSDPVAGLDVNRLAVHVLEPLLAIHDPRRDPRIDFVGGIRGMDALSRRVLSGEMAAAFSLYPTSLAELMAVADADAVMPPKSTWFEPKLRDGLFLMQF